MKKVVSYQLSVKRATPSMAVALSFLVSSSLLPFPQ